jgi:hypothetical protein
MPEDNPVVSPELALVDPAMRRDAIVGASVARNPTATPSQLVELPASTDGQQKTGRARRASRTFFALGGVSVGIIAAALLASGDRESRSTASLATTSGLASEAAPTQTDGSSDDREEDSRVDVVAGQEPASAAAEPTDAPTIRSRTRASAERTSTGAAPAVLPPRGAGFVFGQGGSFAVDQRGALRRFTVSSGCSAAVRLDGIRVAEDGRFAFAGSVRAPGGGRVDVAVKGRFVTSDRAVGWVRLSTAQCEATRIRFSATLS